MSELKKRMKYDVIELIKELGNIENRGFFYDNVYFNEEGKIVLNFSNTKSNFIQEKLILDKYDDLQLINFELPADKQFYSDKAYRFWSAAKKVEEAPEDHKDIFIKFKALLSGKFNSWIGLYDKNPGWKYTTDDPHPVGTKGYIIRKNYLEKAVYDKYVKTYKIYD